MPELNKDFTREIVTPIMGKTITLKTVITGAEREKIESATTKYVTAGGSTGKEISVTDMEALLYATRHQMLRICVISIDKDETDCLDRLRQMPDDDYQFVIAEVENDQKKIVEGLKRISER